MFFSDTSDHLFVSNEEHHSTNVTSKCHTQNHSNNPRPSTTTNYNNIGYYHHEYKLPNNKEMRYIGQMGNKDEVKHRNWDWDQENKKKQ